MAQVQDIKMGEHPEAEDHKKTSMVGKVKNKAKKLSSKIKGVSKKKDRQGVEGEHVGEREGTSTSSSSGEEEGEEESPRGVQDYKETRVPAASPESKTDHEVHGGQGYAASRGLSPGEEYQASRGIAGLKLGDVEAKEDPAGPAPTPAGWTQFEKEPAKQPSWDEPGKRQHDVPAALGQESAGISSGLGALGSGNKSADRDPDSVATGTPVGYSSEEKIPEGILKPRGDYQSEDTKPVVDGVDSSGRDLLASEVVDPEEKIQPSRVEEQRPSFQDLANRSPSEGAEGGYSAERGSGGFDSTKNELLGGTAAAGAAGALGAAAGSDDKELKPSDSQKGWMQRATEGVTSVKNVLTSKLASPKAPEEKEETWTESARENSLGGNDTLSPSSGPTNAAQGKTWTDSARDTATYVKDTVGSKLPSSTGPKDVPVTEQAADSASNTEQKAADTTSSYSTRAVETATGLKDTIASKLGYGQSAASPTSESLVGEHPSSAASDPNQPGVTQKVLGTVTGAKDAVVSKLGYGTEATKGAAADSTTSPKDNSKLFTPDEHDAALSEKITNMLTLGGSKSPGKSTPTSETKSTPTSETAAETTAQSKEQGKGVMDRVSETVGSMWGKKPADEKPVTGTTDPSLAVKDEALTGGHASY